MRSAASAGPSVCVRLARAAHPGAPALGLWRAPARLCAGACARRLPLRLRAPAEPGPWKRRQGAGSSGARQL